MRVLAVDTVSPLPSLTVLDGGPGPGGPEVRLLTRLLPPGAAEALASAVSSTLSEAGLDVGALDRVAILSGPGSFTGLRAGLAFCRGLSRALGISLSAVPTLEAALDALSSPENADVILGAGRGEVYRLRRRPGTGMGPGDRPSLETAVSEAAASGAMVLDLDALLVPLSPALARRTVGTSLPAADPDLAYGRPSAAEERFGAPEAVP
jgi:tRNA threonylcarbamoyl adenosine modification protein YeaZ